MRQEKKKLQIIYEQFSVKSYITALLATTRFPTYICFIAFSVLVFKVISHDMFTNKISTMNIYLDKKSIKTTTIKEL